MSAKELPLHLSTLGVIGFIGSVFRDAQTENLNIDAVLYSVVWQVLVAIGISLIIIVIVRHADNEYSKKKHSSIVIFTWVYFSLGVISLLRLLTNN